MTTIMLKKMGFEVISATDGVEAVEKFKQHKESVGCLITDLAMPQLDGWGTLCIRFVFLERARSDSS